MVSGRRGWFIVLLALLVGLPTAAAELTSAGEEEARELLDEAASALPRSAPDPADALPEHERDDERRNGSGAPHGGSEETGADALMRRGQAEAQHTERNGAAAAADLMARVDELDAAGLVDQTLQPVQQKADELRGELEPILAEDGDQEAEPEPVAPASASTGSMDLSTPLLIAAAGAAATGVALVWLAGSSTGAGGAATGAKLAGRDLRRLLPLASPLFTRFEKDTVLGHPKREAIYALVMQNPGVTLQDLCRQMNLSRTAVGHHLRLMEQQHLILSKRMGRTRHYYENGGRYGRDQKEALAILQNERSRRIADFIDAHPGAIQKRICEEFGIQASVAHWHVKRLREANLIEPVRAGRTVSYYPSGTLRQVASA